MIQKIPNSSSRYARPSNNPGAGSFKQGIEEAINPDYGVLSRRGIKGLGYTDKNGTFYPSVVWQGEVWAYSKRYLFTCEQFTRPCPIAHPVERIDRKTTYGKLRHVAMTTMEGELVYQWSGGEADEPSNNLALNILIDAFNAPDPRSAKGNIENYGGYQVTQGYEEATPSALVTGAEAWLSAIGY